MLVFNSNNFLTFYFFNVLRQICKIRLIARGLSVSVSVCVSVTVVSTGHNLAKIKIVKADVCRFFHLPSNGVIAKIVLRDIDLLFGGKNVKCLNL